MALGEEPAIGSQAGATVEVRVLGGFDVRLGTRHLGHADWGRLSAERLVKLLVITPGHRITRELAAETLWPGAVPDAGRSNLRKAIHFARHALGADDVLASDGDAVTLDGERLDLDLDRLLGAMAQCTGGADATAGPEAADAALETLLALGDRDLLPEDVYEDWLVGPRERLRDAWLRSALHAATRARERGRGAEALVLVHRVLDRDPCDEAAHRLAIELYAAEGRHHAARRQFDLCRTVLRAELDVDPSPATLEAFRGAERGAGRDAPHASPSAVLVARRAELEQVEPAFDRLAAGQMAVVLFHGPTGIGKTRLLQEVVAYGRAARWRVITWQAVEALRTEAFAPLALKLAEVLTTEEVSTWTEPARSGVETVVAAFGPPALTFRERSALDVALIEAMGAMARSAPLVLALDDLPWVDEPSLDLLGALVAARPASPILVAGSYRDDEPIPDALDRLLEQARRSGAIMVPVGPLASRDLEPLLLGQLGGQGVGEDVTRALFAVGGGNPLFSLEAVRSGTGRGAVRLEDGRWTLVPGHDLDDLPASARQLVARRGATMPRGARELLDVAAELGPLITFEVLSAAVPDREHDLIETLDEALGSGLLVEQGGGYAFAHPLYRVAVRSVAGRARRATMQLRIARALAGDAASGSDPRSLRTAAAGSPDPTVVAERAFEAVRLGHAEAAPLAVAFGLAAAGRHAAVHDRAEAARLYEEALGLWPRLAGDEPSAWGISGGFVGLGALRALAGDMDGAADAFREATALAATPDEIAHAYLEFADAVPYRQGDFEGTRSILAEGMARLPPECRAGRAMLGAVSGWCLFRMRRIDEAVSVIQGAYDELGDAPEPHAAIRVLDALGVVLHYAGQAAAHRRAYLERARSIAVEMHDSTWEAVTTLHLGVLFVRDGEPARGRFHIERALQLARVTGDRYVELVAVWVFAETADALGDYPAAVEARLREVQLLDATGGNAHNAALAHAHLAHLALLMGDAATHAAEADVARTLARQSEERGYPERIDAAIRVVSWTEVDS